MKKVRPLLLVSFSLLCLSARAQEVLPSFVNWSYEGACQKSNGLRSLICLNGWWRWQLAEEKGSAPPEKGWAYRKVPGYGINFNVLGSNGQPLKLKPEEKCSLCWVEREFTVPEEWAGKRVQLVFESIEGDGEIWLDNQKAGYTWDGCVYCLELKPPYRQSPYRLSIKSKGVTSNVWLKALPAGPLITDSYLSTSVRKMTATIRARGTGKAGNKIQVVITDYKQPEKIIRRAGPFPCQSTSDGWKLQQEFPWQDAVLWSLEKPNLYYYYLELQDSQGKTFDRIFPVRFGFREVWIKDGYFMLNNQRITITNDIHSPLAVHPGKNMGRSYSPFTDEETWRKIIRRWKDLGVNCAEYRWGGNIDDEMLFRIADEEGFFITMSVRGIERNPVIRSIPEMAAYNEDVNAYLLYPRRHSPCVPFYYLSSLSSCWDYAPFHLGEDFDTEKLFGKTNREERALVEKLDPVRAPISGSYSGGGKTEPFHSSMNYIGIHVDMQSYENWPSRWYQHKNKPLMTYEMAVPPYIAEWYQRPSRGTQAHGVAGVLPFFLECGAIYLGEEPYLMEPKEKIATWLENVSKGKNPGYPARGGSLTYEKVAELFTHHVFRSWKTYGVNMGFFVQVREFFEEPRQVFEIPKVDPRQPGIYPDARITEHTFTMGPLRPLGEIARKALSKLLIYIGGPDGQFTLKDHAYNPGETVKKAVVMLNEYETPVTLTGKWQLVRKTGEVVLSGSFPETVLQPGEIAPARVHISFSAPAVQARTDFILRLKAEANRPGSLEDEFALTVFPEAARPLIKSGTQIFVYDPVGDTTQLLRKAGVNFQLVSDSLPDPENGLLIVGRNCLQQPAGKNFNQLMYKKLSYDFATNLSNGMRVLVFEQALDNLWGLKTEQARWRRAFITAAGHPVLENLQPADFLYLKGHGNLVDPYPEEPPATTDRIAGSRFPRWGLDNTVVTYSLVRPQLAAARSLLSCGFDLQESALLEVAAGKGRMIFCQVDVTNRYGTDPVSTRLVNNLLSYLTNVSPPDPTIPRPLDLVREGLEDAPLPVSTEKVFMVDRLEGPVSWGITRADLYFQGFLELPLLKGPDGKKYLYWQLPGKKQVCHTLNRKNFLTRWQRMKSMMIVSALTINQGGSSDIFPRPALQDNNEELYPLEWLEGFVHPYTLMQW